MSTSITITVAGLDETMKRLDGFAAASQAAMADAVEAVALDIASEARRRAPVNTGALRASIAARGVSSTPTEARAEAGSTAVYAAPMEDGREPGKHPGKAAIPAIELWVKRKGLAWTRHYKTKPDRPMTVTEMAWAVAAVIKKRGIKGRHYMAGGLLAARASIGRKFAAVYDAALRTRLRGA